MLVFGDIFRRLLAKPSFGLAPAFRYVRVYFSFVRVSTFVSVATLSVIAYLLVFPMASIANPAVAAPVSCAAPHATVSCLSISVSNSQLVVGGGAITPQAGGVVASASHDITVKTNAPGYALYLNTDSTNSNLTRTGTPSAVIAPTHGIYGSSLAELDMNSWGFATSSAPVASPIWAKVPDNSSPVAIATVASGNDVAGQDTTVHYGVKVDNDTMSGVYQTTIVYTVMSNAFPAPNVASVSPDFGDVSGGTTVTITGTNFYDTTDVTIGGVACTSYTVTSPTSITCVTAAGSAGAKDVVVTTASGSSTLTGGYTYIVPVVVTGVSPNIASTASGIESGPAFTIVGTGFTGATSVKIGGLSCGSFSVLSDAHILCTGPNSGLTAGSKAVEVSRASVNSNANIAVNYSATAYPTLQASDVYTQCSATAAIFRDTRDSQLYYVKKMVDKKCWMVDNLKYANYGTVVSEDSKQYLTADGTGAWTAANFEVAKFVDPGVAVYCTGTTDMSINTVTKCGLLYNWYAATNGTGTYDLLHGSQATASICPANFRLPSSLSGAGGATTNGTDYGVADFPVLNASMNAGSLTAGSTTSYPTNWQPSGAWSGVFSGAYGSSLSYQGLNGLYLSSTAHSAEAYVYRPNFNSSEVKPKDYNLKMYGFAVRCVMEDPLPEPSTSVPRVASVLDVTPTTGWGGDAVYITSNALFTNVQSVTVGGTNCAIYSVISSSLISCRLPAKAAGSTNDIAVMNGGTNISNASTYNHMRIKYFDPNRSEMIGGTINSDGSPASGGTTTDHVFFNYPDSSRNFTSTDCGSMTLNQVVNLTDARNNQTYRVKKMTANSNGGRCWMIDNLKFPAGQYGSGGVTGYLTANGSATSGANADVARYVNPMGQSYCYSTANMPTQTLTRCGYSYNWYNATYGTGNSTITANNQNVAGSICPNNMNEGNATSSTWKLPAGGSTAANNQYAWLNALMNNQSATAASTSASYVANWRPGGAWQGVYSGFYSTSFTATNSIGDYGDYHTSTNVSNIYAYNTYFSSTGSTIAPGNGNSTPLKYIGFAMRCVLP